MLKNNINNFYIEADVNIEGKFVNIYLKKVTQNPYIIKKISINGNAITKDKTIRSKLLIEPGDIMNQYLVMRSKENLEKFPYIRSVNVQKESENNNLNFTIDEVKKTGNVLLAGTYDTDTQIGFSLRLDDKNFRGSGNAIDANLNLNSEDLKFDFSYTLYPLFNPYISNSYSIYNQENDFTDSFGYKLSKQGVSYKISFSQNEKIDLSLGFSFSNSKGYSPKDNTIDSISDNIGNFTNFDTTLNIINDSTNDMFNPTKGSFNRVSFTISPNDISDDPFYKLILTNKNYLV